MVQAALVKFQGEVVYLNAVAAMQFLSRNGVCVAGERSVDIIGYSGKKCNCWRVS